MIKPQKLTEAGMARELGVSRQAVHDLVKRAILQKDDKGMIDVETAKVALINSVRPSGKTANALQDFEPVTPPANPQPLAQPLLTAPDQDPEITNYHIAKTLREAAEAQIARLKLAEMQGDLIRVDAIKTTLATVFATTRDALLQLPDRLAPLMAAETDATAVHTLLHAEIHQALHHLSGAADRIGTPEASVQ